MREKRDALPTSVEEIEMSAYESKNEKDRIVHDRLSDDIENGVMSEQRAKRIYNLYRNNFISFEEVREFRGSLLIDRQTQSDDPTEDALMKISSLSNEATHWRGKAKEAGDMGETRPRDILNDFAHYCEVSADKSFDPTKTNFPVRDLEKPFNLFEL